MGETIDIKDLGNCKKQLQLEMLSVSQKTVFGWTQIPSYTWFNITMMTMIILKYL